MFVCPRCFGPLEATYDLDSASADASTGRPSMPVPHRSGATPSSCPSSRIPTEGVRVGLSPLVPTPRLAAALGLERLWVKDDSRNPTLSFKDRVVACGAARASSSASPRSPAPAPATSRRRSRLPPPRIGLRRGRLHPRRPGARQGGPGTGAGRHGRARGRTLRRGQPAVPGADRRAGGLGGRQRQPAPVLRRGLQDHRVRDRPAAGLADARCRRRAARVGVAVHQARPRLRGAGPRRAHRRRRRSASSVARRPGCGPIAARLGGRRRRGPPGGAARHASSARWPSARPPTGRMR